jgi:hypothetical protein
VSLARSIRYGQGMIARHMLAIMYPQDVARVAAAYPALAAFRPERWFSLDPDTAASVAAPPNRRLPQ